MSEKVEGLDKVLRALQRISNSVPEAVQIRALKEAGEIVAAEARLLVPVASGNLRDSIIVSDRGLGGAFSMDSELEGGGVKVFIGPRTGRGGPDGFYGHMVEFGTINMPAQPFMRPAFDRTRSAVQKRLGDALWEPIEKAAKG